MDCANIVACMSDNQRPSTFILSIFLFSSHSTTPLSCLCLYVCARQTLAINENFRCKVMGMRAHWQCANAKQTFLFRFIFCVVLFVLFLVGFYFILNIRQGICAVAWYDICQAFTCFILSYTLVFSVLLACIHYYFRFKHISIES